MSSLPIVFYWAVMCDSGDQWRGPTLRAIFADPRDAESFAQSIGEDKPVVRSAVIQGQVHVSGFAP